MTPKNKEFNYSQGEKAKNQTLLVEKVLLIYYYYLLLVSIQDSWLGIKNNERTGAEG